MRSWLWLLWTEQAKVQPIEKFSLLFQLLPLTLFQSKTVIYPTEQHRIHGKNHSNDSGASVSDAHVPGKENSCCLVVKVDVFMRIFLLVTSVRTAST
jgi:hypothetical protein